MSAPPQERPAGRAGAPTPRPSRGRRLVALFAALVALGATIALGNWQTRRGDAKEALQAEWDRLAGSAPRALSAADLDDGVLPLPARVRVTGRFDPARAVWLQNRMIEGRTGFQLVMPMEVAPGRWVLVQRGWVPRDPADRLKRPDVVTPTGTVTVEGVALPGLPRLLDLGEPAEQGSLPAVWQNLDLPAYRRASGLPVAPLVVQQTDADADGLQRRWPQPAIDVGKHRGYAFQWYGLAALIVLLTLRYTMGPTLVAGMRRTFIRTEAGRPLWPMWLVAVVCVVPVIASYVAYYVMPPSGRTNYGALVLPQRPVPPLALRTLDGGPGDSSALKGKWTLLTVDRAACAEACARKLWNMRQVRLTTGREMDRVARALLLVDDGSLDPALQRAHDGTQFLRARPDELLDWLGPVADREAAPAATASPSKGAPPAGGVVAAVPDAAASPASRLEAVTGHVWLVDPLGHLMMRWPRGEDPNRMKRDLERLLKASRVG